jgi:hypothetical protein
MYCLPAKIQPPYQIRTSSPPPSYSAGVGDCAARGGSTGASAVLGDRVVASPNDDDTSPSRPALASAAPAVAAAVPPAIGSGDSVRSIAICWPSRDSGGRTPPRRKRGIGREPRRSVGGGGGSESSAVLGIHERNVRGDRVSACVVVVAVDGAGLDRALEVAADPIPIPIPVPVPVPVPEPVPAPRPRLALSEVGLHGNSGRRVGKNRRGGTHVVFGERREDVVGVVESSVSVSGLGSTLLLPSRPEERRREVKSVKSTVRERAGSRRIDGWRVSGGADGTAVGDGGPHPSGEVSRRRTQSSRRVAERSM